MSGPRFGALALITMLAACSGAPRTATPGPAPSPQTLQVVERQVVQRASMDITVEDLPSSADRVRSVVDQADGTVESSRADGDKKVRFDLRVPADALPTVLDDLRTLGKVDHEYLNSDDVTEHMSGLTARLGNLIALRDRLREYLDRTETLDEVMAIERELTRVQTEIDSITAQLERLRSRVAMSLVSLELSRKRQLGPLGLVASGAAWVAGKLVFLD